MASDDETHDTPTRFRPRFSVRTLVVIVTLVCVYAACWGPTRERGELEVFVRVHGVVSPNGDRQVTAEIPVAALPLVISADLRHYRASQSWGPDQLVKETNAYYFWFFGYVAKLPYEREL